MTKGGREEGREGGRERDRGVREARKRGRDGGSEVIQLRYGSHEILVCDG